MGKKDNKKEETKPNTLVHPNDLVQPVASETTVQKTEPEKPATPVLPAQAVQSIIPVMPIRLEEYLANKDRENKTLIAGFNAWCRFKNKVSASFKEYEQLLIEYKTRKIT